jgi:hypothetical protein
MTKTTQETRPTQAEALDDLVEAARTFVGWGIAVQGQAFVDRFLSLAAALRAYDNAGAQK